MQVRGTVGGMVHGAGVMDTQLRTVGPEVHPEVAAAPLPEGVMLTHVPHDGAVMSVTLSAAAEVPFELSRPARRIPGYRHQRNMPGWWWSSSTRSHVVYESWLERHQLIELDRRPGICGISGQPFALSWTGELRRERHVPDFFARSADGSAMVIDCRPLERADEKFYFVAAITKSICQELNWEYHLAGAPDPTRAANLRWLAGYRRNHAVDSTVAEVLLEVSANPVELVVAANAAGDPVLVLATLFTLLWSGALTCDLDMPLTDHTMIWAARG